jgi:hypothetical protein
VNRTDENRTIAVVRTRLPYTDRRSLSQAWFSALHLSEAPSASTARGPRRAPGAALAAYEGPRPSGPPNAAGKAGEAPWLAPRHRGGVESAAAGDGCAPGRAARSRPSPAKLGPRARSHPPLRTSLTVGVAGERVALVLRRDGTTLHVVAVCRPGVEDAVRRALAQAAAEVRRHGEAMQASVRALGERQP